MRYRICLVAVLALGLGVNELFAASVLNFPRASFDTNTFTGLAFVNPGTTTARLTFNLYASDGSDALPETTRDIPAGTQQALLLTDLFKQKLPADRVCWMQVTSDQDGITGFFLFLNNTVSLFDGADLPQISRRLFFNQVRHGGGYKTEVNIINPGSDPATVQLELFRPGKASVTATLPASIPPHGVVRLNPSTVFSLTEIPAGSYLLAAASTGSGIGGFELIRGPKDLMGLNAVPASSGQKILYFPQMAVLGPWQTDLGIVNYSEEAAILTITAFKPDGTPHAGDYLKGANPATRQLPGSSSLAINVAELFGFQQAGSQPTTVDGWLRVESTNSSVAGYVSYGVTQAGSLAAVPSQSTALTKAFFSHVATDLGYFTGLALLNPGQLTNNYRVVVLKKDGTVLGSFDGVLRPGERVSRLVTEFVPAAARQSGGFIWVSSNQALYATSLFGTAKAFNPSLTAEILANIPPQSAPAAFQPAAPQPLQIQPSLAVLQPTAEQQFTVSGSSKPVVWKINGSTTPPVGAGTISAIGLYRAPGSTPTTLPVSISAETTDKTASSGASVDVLRRSLLTSGQGTIQSVTFLRSQQRLYAAELLSSGTSAVQGDEPAANANSQIRALLPQAVLLKSLPGEEISKMIGFDASDGKEYLLVTTLKGRLLRLDPRLSNPPLVEISNSLDSPTSMVFDPISGNLLVADGSRIVTIPKSTVEKSLFSALRTDTGEQEEKPKHFIGGLEGPQGVAVDACTGNLYVSDYSGIWEVDRLSGSRRILGTYGFPGEILGLYRKETACPGAFQLLTSDPEARQIRLYAPSQGYSTLWISNSAASTNDIAYLPSGNSLVSGGPTSILFGDRLTTSGQSNVYAVPVPSLYVDQQPNTGIEPSLSNVSDPRGDTVGTIVPQIDLLEVASTLSTEERLIVTLTFATPITPFYQGYSNGLAGVIGLDTDQNPATGSPVWPELELETDADLGIDYLVWLWQEDAGGGAAILRYYGLGEFGHTELAGNFAFSPDGLSVTVDIPFANIDPDGAMDFLVVVGNDEEPTDFAPNRGFLTTGRGGSGSGASSEFDR